MLRTVRFSNRTELVIENIRTEPKHIIVRFECWNHGKWNPYRICLPVPNFFVLTQKEKEKKVILNTKHLLYYLFNELII